MLTESFRFIKINYVEFIIDLLAVAQWSIRQKHEIGKLGLLCNGNVGNSREIAEIEAFARYCNILEQTFWQ